MTAWTLPPALIPSTPSADTTDHPSIARLIADTLADFDVETTVTRWDVGPVVSRYEIVPAAGVKVAQIRRLADDLALALAAQSLRVVAPIPGRRAVGIEVPNAIARTVMLGDYPLGIGAPPLSFALGVDVAGTVRTLDLARAPHLLIAGATGSGKSVQVNALVSGLLMRNSPETLRLILVDLKRVELASYRAIPHLLVDVITEPGPALAALRWAVSEMERRYRVLERAGVRSIAEHDGTLPFIVIVIDELADLMIRGKAVEKPIVRLAQKARATGIHLVLATQRPSVDVVTGLIKANVPTRIAFAMTSNTDSRTVLDAAGAEDLVGRGDMLFQPATSPHAERLQGLYVTDRDIAAIADHWRAQGTPTAVLLPAEDAEDAGPPDALLEEAWAIVSRGNIAGPGVLQRHLHVDYARASAIVAQLVASGRMAEDGRVIR